MTGQRVKGFRDFHAKVGWPFWLACAAIIPMAYAASLLTCLYLLSFLVTPGGLIAKVGLFVQTVFLVWATWNWIKDHKVWKAERGLLIRPRRIVNALVFCWAVMSITAPIVPIAVSDSVPDATAKQWKTMSLWFRHKELGF